MHDLSSDARLERGIMTKFTETCKQLIETKKCRGNCCGPTPMPPDYIVKFKDQLCAEVVSTTKVYMRGETWHVHHTGDMFCIFLNREKRLCSIYEHRTWICKAYGESDDLRLWCSKIAQDGTLRTRADRRRVLRGSERFFKKTVAKARRV